MSAISALHQYITSTIERASFVELLCIECALEWQYSGAVPADFTRALKARFAELCCD